MALPKQLGRFVLRAHFAACGGTGAPKTCISIGATDVTHDTLCSLNAFRSGRGVVSMPSPTNPP